MNRHPRLLSVFTTLLLALVSTDIMAQAALPHTARIFDKKGISVSYPDGWSVGQPTANSWVVLNVPANQQDTATPSVRVVIGCLERIDHADAVSQLAEYANESNVPSTFLVIGGWPALQRVQLVRRPQPSEGPPHPDLMMVQITTAVAAGNLLVRLEGRLPSDADQKLKDVVLAIGQSLVFSSTGDPTQVRKEVDRLSKSPRRLDAPQVQEELNRLNQSLRRPQALPGNVFQPELGAPLLGAAPTIFPTVRLDNLGTQGELEVAVSSNGTNIVVVKQGGFITSNDGGNTFPSFGGFGFGDGDSSIAFGQSGAFYAAGLFGGNCPANSNCVEVTRSTDNGGTFPNANLVNGAVCPNSGAGNCSVDQEHIAADRINAGLRNGDRVYMAYRDLTNGVGNVTCSPDSNATTAPANSWGPPFTLETGSDFPRVAVGSDGFLYVVYITGGNSGAANIRIDKFNACTSSTTPVTRAAGGFPKTVSAYTNFAGCQICTPSNSTACQAINGFGGLDRCNNGNVLSSPTVTVDDSNPNHVYVAWANNTAANNDNVLVADSTDGGVTWQAAGHAPVTINANVTARRYMPWVCASGGDAFVTWYDRRAATAASNDLTDIFAASAALSAGNLVANNDEFKVSTTSDPQCNLWPTGPRSAYDSENCSVQPQNAGNCSITKATRCDFSGGDGTQCPMGETCQTDGFQTNPKYGDYNGNACILGRMYTVFASGAGLNRILDFFNSFVVTPTPTTVTYTGATTADFHDDAVTSATLTLSGTSAPVAGQTIKFTIGTQSCSAMTSAAGVASCSPPIILNQIPGPYTVTASFLGNGNFQASSASKPFTITKEETTTTYTGPTVIANGVLTTFSAVLLEDGDVTKPISGRTITITLGTGATAQTCSGGPTDATGKATCPILVNQPLGPGTVAAKFAGDAFYLPSAASANTILFAFLAHGSFVLGDQTAVVGPNTVTFWGATWSSQNALSGGSAPDSFKGFASAISTNPPACGDTWTSTPGNSSRPPAKLPSFMGVVVSTSVSKSGSTLSGNVRKIVVVQTNPGYAPNPGHPGTGSVIAVFCQ